MLVVGTDLVAYRTPLIRWDGISQSLNPSVTKLARVTNFIQTVEIEQVRTPRLSIIRDTVAATFAPRSPWTLPESHEQLPHHAPMHVGEAVVSALESVDQLFVIKTEQVQNGRLQVVDIDGVFGNGKA